MIKKSLQAHLLAANPNNPDDDLGRSVILLTSYTASISIGLQINRMLSNITLPGVANNLGIWYEGNDSVYYGGNSGVNKIHIIHSSDWSGPTTIKLSNDISITNDITILAAISQGEGPELYRACAGHWVWENGDLTRQLENRDSLHKWEPVPATMENIFSLDGYEQWRSILEESARHQVAHWF